MCGRFAGYRDLDALKAHFPIDRVDAVPAPSYNVAPAQLVPAIVRQGEENVLRAFRWGLVPAWAKDPAVGSRLINARSETVDAKPSFRNAFRKRRCLIPADGFYEWKGEPGSRQPVYITLPGDEPFAFAGLWEIWDDGGKAEAPLYTCAILTTDASPSLRDVHHRMPVILKPEALAQWIDGATSPEALAAILQAQIQRDFNTRQVSRAVNSSRNDAPNLIAAR